MGDEFDSWLESELREGFTRMTPRMAPPGRFRSRPRVRLAALPLVPVALTGKAVAVFAAAAVVAGGGAAAVSDATGHSTFGHDVSTKAQLCAQHLSRGAVGDCVSDFVLQSNPGSPSGHSDATTAGAAAGHGAAATHSTPPANPSGAAGTHSAPVEHPTGKP